MGDVMNKKYAALGCLAVSLVVAGCNRNRDNLLFVDTNVLGVQATAGGAQGTSARLGYANLSVAKVPIVARDEVTGHPHQLTVNRGGIGNSGTYSVFAQFDANNTGQNVGLGRFFATGFAAQALAEGWQDRLAKN